MNRRGRLLADHGLALTLGLSFLAILLAMLALGQGLE